MRILLLGSTGLLGQAIAKEAHRREHSLRSAARKGAEIILDIADRQSLEATLSVEQPDTVVNCAALVSIDDCERDTHQAWSINTRPLAILGEWSRETGGRIVQISTDHYYPTGASIPHDEDAPVTIANEYARTKYAAESIALTSANALVLRTSIVGIRGWPTPTLAEWAIDVAKNDRPVKLFSDAYTSSIDVRNFARATFDLLDTDYNGLLNLAAGEVYSKENFVREIAAQLGRPLTAQTVASIADHSANRASCLGLDVKRAEGILGYRLPNLKEVVASILEDIR